MLGHIKCAKELTFGIEILLKLKHNKKFTQKEWESSTPHSHQYTDHGYKN